MLNKILATLHSVQNSKFSKFIPKFLKLLKVFKDSRLSSEPDITNKTMLSIKM